MPVRDNILESISQIKGQIIVKIFGDDVTVLRELATARSRGQSRRGGPTPTFVDR